MSDIISRLRDAYMRNPAEALHMLPELFEAEEQNTVFALPCKIGSKIYRIVEKSGSNHVCKEGLRKYPPVKMIFTGVAGWKDWDKFGRTVFLTRSAAEQALKEAEK